MTCYISNQIAEHCNQNDESICPKCGGNMYIELGETDLICEECEYKQEDDNFD